MKVCEIMTRKIEYIDADASVYDAIEKMVDKRIRSLVVRDGRQGEGYGVITVRDIAFKVIEKGIDPQQIKVEEITSKPLMCIQQDAPIEHVLDIMQKFNISRVFVRGEVEPVGVVSLLDVVEGALIQRAKKGRCV